MLCDPVVLSEVSKSHNHSSLHETNWIVIYLLCYSGKWRLLIWMRRMGAAYSCKHDVTEGQV